MTVSFGVHIGQQNLPMDDMRQLWRQLEEAEIDWISVWDHFYEAPYQGGSQPHFEALTTLGALAAETSRVRIGCLVFYVGYRNPALLAKATATLDHLSGGRFELGLGAGWHIHEATAYGYAFPDICTRLDMLDESAEVVRCLLEQPRTTFSGKHFQVDDATCWPKPVQRRLPIWIGGRGERRTLEIAARRADGWNAAYTSAAEFARLNAVLDHWCEAGGRDPSTIVRGANVAFHLGMDDAAAKRERAELESVWGGQAGRIAEGALLGTPNSALERLMAYVEGGADAVNIALRAPWNDDALQAYLGEVLPAIRRELAKEGQSAGKAGG